MAKKGGEGGGGVKNREKTRFLGVFGGGGGPIGHRALKAPLETKKGVQKKS